MEQNSELLRLESDLSDPSAIIPTNNKTKGKLIMGYIEIFRMNEEGAGWVDLSEATSEEILDLEIGLFQEGAL
jgi:hypothetical protein